MRKVRKKMLIFSVLLLGFSTKNVFAGTYDGYSVGDQIKYDPVSNSVCESGDTCYTWYVINNTDEGISMILSTNLGEKTKLTSATELFTSTVEPDIATNYLKTLTNTWVYKGRLLTADEAYNLLGITSYSEFTSFDKAPYLASTYDNTYWLDGISTGYCLTIGEKVSLSYNGSDTNYYVRPVIDIIKAKVATIKTTDSDVTILGDSSILSKISKVSVEKYSSDSDVYKSLMKIFQNKAKIIAYDFNLYDSNNNVIQPGGTVEVNIVLPSNINIDKLKLWYVDNDYNAEQLSFSVSNNVLSFKTTHFSTYVLTEDVDGQVVEVEDTAFDLSKLGLYTGLTVVVIGAIVIVQSSVRKKRKNK